jgi:tRNA modification GTPase
VCLDGARPLNDWEREQLRNAPSAQCMFVRTKADLSSDERPGILSVSSHTGQGLQNLQSAIAARLQESAATSADVVATTAVRCRDSLRQASECIARARAISDDNQGEELVAHELRLALDHLGHVVGAVYTEDILDRIFGRFCIGK